MYSRFVAVAVVGAGVAVGQVLPLAERHFGATEVGRVDEVVGVAWSLEHTAGVREGLGHIRLDGLGHRGQKVVRHREYYLIRVSAYQFLVPCLDGFALIARQNR